MSEMLNTYHFKLRSPWLQHFSIQNVMSANCISIRLFEAIRIELKDINDILIELILYLSIGLFSLATEKRYVAIAECDYSDHKIEDGYGRSFLTALQNERKLIRNQNFIERQNKK